MKVFTQRPLNYYVEIYTCIRVSIHGTRDVVGVDCGDEVAAWMSAFLNTPGLRLIWQNQLEHDVSY